MKRLFAFLGFILLAGIGTFLMVPFIVSAETVRDAVAAQLETSTGRRVVLAGPASLAVFPNVAVRIADVSMANAEGMGPEPLLAMDALNASVKLMPLLRGAVEIDSFVLVRPRFNFHVDGRGRPNWHLGGEAAKATAAAEGSGEGKGVAGSIGVREVRIGEMRIEDGMVSYTDARNAAKAEISSVNASLTWPSLSQPVTASGSLIWQGEMIKFDTSLLNPLTLASGGGTGAKLAAITSFGSLAFDGHLSTAVDFAAEGTLNVNVSSLRALARWQNKPLPPGGGLEAMTLAGKLTAGGPKFSLSNVALSLDGNQAEGAVVVKLDGQRPLIQATLALSQLDLNPYLATQIGAPVAGQPGTGAGNGDKTAADWSDAPIDLSGLHALDADLRLSAGRIALNNMPLGGGAFMLALKQGRLSLQVADLQAYDGKISGTFVANSTSKPPSFSASFEVQGANLQPLLSDTAGFRRLSGTGSLNGEVKTSGASQRELAQSLSGTFALSATNGVLNGVDLLNVVQTLKTGALDGWGSTKAQTRFDQMQASFTIDAGIARNSDLIVNSPAARLTGAGLVDLPKRTLDYRVVAALVDRASDPTGGVAAALLEIPIIVRGPWANPAIFPDPVGMITNAPVVKQTVEGVGEALSKGDIKGVEDAFEKSGAKSIFDTLTGRKKK